MKIILLALILSGCAHQLHPGEHGQWYKEGANRDCIDYRYLDGRFEKQCTITYPTSK